MRITVLLSVVAVVAVSSVSIAFAGWKTSSTTFVNANNAGGQIGSTRASADTTQYIQCSVSVATTGNYVSCSARNAAGTNASCYSYAANYVTVVSTIGPNSQINFDFDASGQCTFLYVSNGSRYLPVTP